MHIWASLIGLTGLQKKDMKLEGGHVVGGEHVEGDGEKVGVAYDHSSLCVCVCMMFSRITKIF